MIPEGTFRYAKRKLQRIPYKLQKFSHRLQESLRKRGLQGTSRAAICKIDEFIRSFIRSLTPERRRAKDKAREFDRKHGVKTEYVISLDDLDVWSRAKFSGGYQATPPSALRAMLGGLQIAYEDFVFVDLGSGMGRAVLIASEFPFKKIIGVEFSSELHRVAQQNVRNFRSGRQECRHIELVCVDAVEYPVPAENTVFYLYNPFQGPKMELVLENIRRSLEDYPHEILITYFNAYHDLFEMAPFLERVRSGREANNSFVIYRNKKNHKALEDTGTSERQYGL